jgi:hypothetical protein
MIGVKTSKCCSKLPDKLGIVFVAASPTHLLVCADLRSHHSMHEGHKPEAMAILTVFRRIMAPGCGCTERDFKSPGLRRRRHAV